jgi:hypothetical protein
MAALHPIGDTTVRADTKQEAKQYLVEICGLLILALHI